MNRSMFVVAAMAIVVGRATAAELKPEAAATFDRYVAAQETRMAAGQASASSFLFLRSLPAAQQREQIAAIRDGELLVQKLGNPPQAGGALLAGFGLVEGKDLTAVLGPANGATTMNAALPQS